MNAIAKTKICIKCHIKKPLSKFTTRKDSKDGFNNLCKICRSQYDKQKYLNNIEKVKQQGKQWHFENPQYSKQYYLINQDEILYKKKQYGQDPINREKNNKYNRQRYKNDPEFKMSCLLRNRNWYALESQGVKKSTKTVNLIGCTTKEFKNYIEKQFLTGMTWSNHGNKNDQWAYIT